MDPWLMLDELRGDRADLGGGFPPHPHRGMQTLTYLREGGIVHEDSRGHRGEVVDGGVQWMSAGAGIIHSEMPTSGRERFHGFQLWVNLPAGEKMRAPRYRDIPAADLGELDGGTFHARAIAGTWTLSGQSVRGPLKELEPLAALLDLTLEAGARPELALDPEETLLVYLYAGTLAMDGHELGEGELGVLGAGDRWSAVTGDSGAACLLLRGRPLREPIAAWGPFVMNTREEIEQAIADYRSGRFG
jgi:redox-sensitive bicupin YhaK (pirin superfamily)